MTFDLDLWPTNLNINMDHQLSTYQVWASRAKYSWVISFKRCLKLTWPLTFDLLTWISIGIIHASRTINLPSLKLLGQSVLDSSVTQGSGIPTYQPTNMYNAICPSFFEGGIIHVRNHEQYKYKTKSTPTQITLLQDLRSGPYCLWQNNKYTIIMSQIR